MNLKTLKSLENIKPKSEKIRLFFNYIWEKNPDLLKRLVEKAKYN